MDAWVHVNNQHTVIRPEDTFSEDHPQIKQDILQMIVQYLQDEGYSSCATILQDARYVPS